ncbi:hypothetical protein DPMN_013934 [Dreissena polymorpha]|uniref:Uncharacterized protein n=1 Tax=Dreissena polymorpha TaxID=45954 RepID=A0A9D4N8H8_DREPO|nr:hypothetical protein DPMN_013934 [Dreissena polymorpha]
MAPLAVTGCRLHPRDGFPSALSALSTAAPGSLFKATPRCSWVPSPQKEPRVRPVCPSTGGLAVPPYPSLYRRDLWTGTGRRTLDEKQRIGQVRCILEKTAIPAVRKTSVSRLMDSAGFAEPSAEAPAASIDLLQAAPRLGRDEHAPAADRVKPFSAAKLSFVSENGMTYLSFLLSNFGQSESCFKTAFSQW